MRDRLLGRLVIQDLCCVEVSLIDKIDGLRRCGRLLVFS